MDFHFIKLNYNGTYLSLVDPNSKSRFVCFAEKDMAMKCVDYAAEFRARNRIWPSLDMSSENRKLELNFFNEVLFVAIKNGKHNEKGYVFCSPNLNLKKPNEAIHVSEIHNLIIEAFNFN